MFETLAALGVPVVWNLAGGYQREPDGSIPGVLEIHDNTMRECARVFGASVAALPRAPAAERQYRWTDGGRRT